MENSLTFGTLFGNAPPPRPGGEVFRIAYFADLTGRANRGELDSSDDIAARKPIKIEFDSIDEVLEELQPRLRLPLAQGRAVAEFEFSELEAFDADRVFDSWSLLEEVQGIRRRIERSLEKAAAWIKGWHETELESTDNSACSRAVTIPAAETLDELAGLEGRTTAGEEADELSASELMETICGALLRGPARERQLSSEKLLAAADECVNVAARTVLHHPDFQALEGVWRELDWLLRRVDKGGRVQVLLFDVSAEEFAADLARSEDLAETGLYRLLVGKLLEGKSPQPPSLIIGRYEFDYCPAHAALLGRIANICERLNAPFLSAMSPQLLEDNFKAKDDDRLAAWNELRALTASAYLALALPGFLLRMPYGKQGRSTEKFELEEVDPGNVAASLLWGNAGTFCSALVASAFLKDAKWEFDPNAHRVVDKVPLYISRDDDGEAISQATQVRFALSVANNVGKLGLVPLAGVKDRDSIQVSQLRSLGAGDARLRGAWSGSSATSSSSAPQPSETPVSVSAEPAVSSSASTSSSGIDPELAALLGDTPSTSFGSSDSGIDPELAALLGESPSTSSSSSDSGLDPELAALLGESTSDNPPKKDDDDGLDPELKALLGE
jgi:type VI secretion system ImpC/EvpB family protein